MWITSCQGEKHLNLQWSPFLIYLAYYGKNDQDQKGKEKKKARLQVSHENSFWKKGFRKKKREKAN